MPPCETGRCVNECRRVFEREWGRANVCVDGSASCSSCRVAEESLWLCYFYPILMSTLVQATEDLLAFTIRHTSGVICASLEEARLEVRPTVWIYPI